MKSPCLVVILSVIAALAVATPLLMAVPQQQERPIENLQVLPADMSRDEVVDVMLGALRGLGLPRRGGRGCLHCHVGSMDAPRSTWDYASDAKAAKLQARVMMAMVREINEGFLPRLADHSDDGQRVTCYTCHAGRVNPQPLASLLLDEFDGGGIEQLDRTYRELRGRYFASDAYDFRVGTLIGVADRLAARNDFAASSGIHRLNLEFNDEPGAHAALVRSRLLEALASGGTPAMLARYQQLRDEHPEAAFTPGTLDSLAWTLYRSGHPDAGVALVEFNYSEYPEAFVCSESLGWMYLETGQADRGIQIAEDFLERYPDHEGGKTLLRELSERR